MPMIQCPIQKFMTEFRAEFKPTRRWKYWEPVLDAASDEYEKLKLAFDDQTNGSGIHPAKKPMEGGFSLEKFLADVDPEDAKALGDMFDQMEAKKETERKADEDYRAALAKAEARIAELEATIGCLEIGTDADECAKKWMIAAQSMAEERDRYRAALERLFEHAEDVRNYADAWEWKYGAAWDEEMDAAHEALEQKEGK